MSNEKCYVLIKQGYYWRAKAGGYTESLLEAGRYTSEEADKYVYPKREISKRKIPACEWVTKHHLSEFSEGREILKQERELATLRAQAEAYDKGSEKWAVFDGGNSIITTGPTKALATQGASMLMFGNPDGWDLLMRRGGTCSKVRVCEVTAAGEKPALATNEK